MFLRVRPFGGAGEAAGPQAAARDTGVGDAVTGQGGSLPPGAVEEATPRSFRIRCRAGAVEVLELQREGRAPLDAAAYLRGQRLERGALFVPTAP